MQPMSPKKWIVASGFLWLLAGVSLLVKGLRFIEAGLKSTDSLSFKMSPWLGRPEQAGAILIAIGLMIGFLKGRLVLSKSAQRISARILALKPPIRISQVYPVAYWILLGSMMGLGFSLRFLPIAIDLRGCIDVAIGSALINGSLFYFRHLARATPTAPCD